MKSNDNLNPEAIVNEEGTIPLEALFSIGAVSLVVLLGIVWLLVSKPRETHIQYALRTGNRRPGLD